MSELAQARPPAMAEVEVSAKRTRRRFSAKEKLAILEQANGCTEPGEVGALLRREGLYSSSLCDWRRARERGELDALTPKKRGPAPKVMTAAEKENLQLKKALAKSEARLLLEYYNDDFDKNIKQHVHNTPELRSNAHRRENDRNRRDHYGVVACANQLTFLGDNAIDFSERDPPILSRDFPAEEVALPWLEPFRRF